MWLHFIFHNNPKAAGTITTPTLQMRKQSQRGEMTHYRSPSFMRPLLPVAEARTPGWNEARACAAAKTGRTRAVPLETSQGKPQLWVLESTWLAEVFAGGGGGTLLYLEAKLEWYTPHSDVWVPYIAQSTITFLALQPGKDRYSLHSPEIRTLRPRDDMPHSRAQRFNMLSPQWEQGCRPKLTRETEYLS